MSNNFSLRFIEDTLPCSCQPVYLNGLDRCIYVTSGSVTIEFHDGMQHVASGDVWMGDESIAIVSGTDGATLWRWELVSADHDAKGIIVSAPGVQSTVKLSAAISLDSKQEWLMRCDRVDFPIGGIALTHVHQGPGIRCCLFGDIEIHSEDHVQTFRTAEPWLEVGHDPVLAKTSEKVATAFVRCFILPRACKGKPSIRYVKPEDATKPKSQKYVVFAERYICI